MTERDIHQTLIEAAIAARHRAYAPYSNFKVGAAVQSESGDIFPGVNVENASYGLSICAERSAVVSAVSQGHQKLQVIAVAAQPLASPCGACRQFLTELNSSMKVILVDPEASHRTTEVALNDLLPMAFRFES